MATSAWGRTCLLGTARTRQGYSRKRCIASAERPAQKGVTASDAARTLCILASEDSLKGVAFSEVIALIDQCFRMNPAAGYTSGAGTDDEKVNKPSENTCSAKVFFLAYQQGLDEESTLRLFCEHYERVLEEPNGASHQNLRNFMKHGWAGIKFHDEVLLDKGSHVRVGSVEEV